MKRIMIGMISVAIGTAGSSTLAIAGATIEAVNERGAVICGVN